MLENLNFITGNGDRLCSISIKHPLNTAVRTTIVCPSTVISSKNDDPCRWFGSNTQVHFLQTAGLRYTAAMLHEYFAFLHLEHQRPLLLEGWDLIKKIIIFSASSKAFLSENGFFLNHKCVAGKSMTTTTSSFVPLPWSMLWHQQFSLSLLLHQQCKWKWNCFRINHESQKSYSTLCIFITTCVCCWAFTQKKIFFEAYLVLIQLEPCL